MIADNQMLDSIGDRIDVELADLLRLACDHDQAARECRAAAGRLLVELRQRLPERELLGVVHGLGLDEPTCRMLIEAAAGGRERAG